MNASEFKAKCLALIDEIRTSRKPLRILKHGRPVVDIIPTSSLASEPPQLTLRGKGRIVGDITEPVVPAEAWEADERNL